MWINEVIAQGEVEKVEEGGEESSEESGERNDVCSGGWDGIAWDRKDRKVEDRNRSSHYVFIFLFQSVTISMYVYICIL